MTVVHMQVARQLDHEVNLQGSCQHEARWWTCTVTGLPGGCTSQWHRECRDLGEALVLFSRHPDYLRGTSVVIEESHG